MLFEWCHGKAVLEVSWATLFERSHTQCCLSGVMGNAVLVVSMAMLLGRHHTRCCLANVNGNAAWEV